MRYTSVAGGGGILNLGTLMFISVVFCEMAFFGEADRQAAIWQRYVLFGNHNVDFLCPSWLYPFVDGQSPRQLVLHSSEAHLGKNRIEIRELV